MNTKSSQAVGVAKGGILTMGKRKRRSASVARSTTATSSSPVSSDTEEENYASCATPKASQRKTKKTAKKATSQRLRERLAASERMNARLLVERAARVSIAQW